jgi:hypothetical protein
MVVIELNPYLEWWHVVEFRLLNYEEFKKKFIELISRVWEK